MNTTLICTVGGSHQPIVRAIETLQPGFVCFVCSEDDPATGNKGSYTQITGKGKIIKAHFGDEKPSLPNIPSQVGLAPDNFEILKVPADDFDAIYRTVTEWLTARSTEGEKLVADYTGGTKTMSAALAVAALDDEQVELQLVSGSRANLVRVESGAEQVLPASVESSRFCRRLRAAVSPWARFAYEDTVDALTVMQPPANVELRGEYQRAKDVSRALAAWDRFDHRSALTILASYKARIGQTLGLHLKALEMLNETQGPRREALQLYDLWLNARRRATQRRYDDAVARVYRLLEWTAQWQLRLHAGIETADIPAEKIPTSIELGKNREGRYQAGLFQAWQLIGELLDNAAAEFIAGNASKMLDHLKIRNHSILAHGFEPIDASQWKALANWMEAGFLPMLATLAAKDAGLRMSIDRLQLPDDYSPLMSQDN